ncbi:hypothetical protein PLESTB_001854400 [Pleodorina starrii]|uniref:Uncharacterized protein n=1 Tax=Pleodorina starrii TaxID=330485 RepID=A0A9W6C1D9_9CHLO|nr:hypothetical protein PLESTM_000927400 [Pleodorina starrii]GLC62199.1 hypothetical protein PLESTB_001854400 [Pleodorina starrii]GLC69984.1 hypothetical protein PLESTF_000906700 [Pleodorina starrii]
MEQPSESPVGAPPAAGESLLPLMDRLGPGWDIIAEKYISRRDLGSVRATCRKGRALVDGNLTELELRYLDRLQLVDPSPGEAPSETEARGAAEEAAQTSHWPALLAHFPRCTSLRIRVGPFNECTPRETYQRLAGLDLGEELLGPLADRPETTARIRRLRLQLDDSSGLTSGLRLPPSIMPRLGAMFPALTELQLEGKVPPPDAHMFYSGLVQHLPRIQSLEMGSFEALSHVRLLAAGLTELRELTLGFETLDVQRRPFPFPPVQIRPALTPASAAVLASFPQLRVLRLRGLSPCCPSLRDVLSTGLAPTLECFEAIDRGTPYLQLTRAGASSSRSAQSSAGNDAATTASGSSGRLDFGGGRAASSRDAQTWDTVRLDNDRKTVEAAAVACEDAELSAGRVVLQEAGPAVSWSGLLQHRRRQVVVEVGRLVLKHDCEAELLGEVLRRLGAPETLQLQDVRHRARLVAGLKAPVLEQMAPRLTRLEFLRCSSLTPAVLISTLAALPRCGEVKVEHCARLVTQPQCRRMVRQLLALPAGEELQGRRLRLKIAGPLQQGQGRPLDGDSGNEYTDEEEVVEAREKDERRLTAAEVAVSELVSRVVWRVRGAGLAAELNGELERGGVAARLEIQF